VTIIKQPDQLGGSILRAHNKTARALPGLVEGRQKSVWIAEPLAGGSERQIGQVHAACPEFLKGVQTEGCFRDHDRLAERGA
jgi:hypothetical protein